MGLPNPLSFSVEKFTIVGFGSVITGQTPKLEKERRLKCLNMLVVLVLFLWYVHRNLYGGLELISYPIDAGSIRDQGSWPGSLG